MKARMMMIGSALMASLIGLPAMAQPAQSMGPGMAQGGGPGMGGAGMGQRGMRHAPRDCTQTANPEACKAHQQARDQRGRQKLHHRAAAPVKVRAKTLLIQRAGRLAIERDTLYNVIKEYKEPVLTNTIRSYFSLPGQQN